MDVRVEAGDIGGEDGDGLRDGNELSRRRLGGCCSHGWNGIVATLQKSKAGN